MRVPGQINRPDRRPSRPTLLVAAAAAFVLLTAGKCNIDTADIERGITEAVNQAVDSLDRNSSAWQSILEGLNAKLEGLVKDLPSERRAIKADVASLLTGTVAAAGTELRCSVDFLGRRVKEQLQGILAHFLGRDPPPLVPAVCEVDPPVVDLNLAAADRNRVLFYGYNFDSSVPPSLRVLTSSGSRDASAALNRASPYLATASLAANGANLDAGSVRLVLEWQGRVLSEIGVVQAATPVCEVKDNELAVPAGQLVDYAPPKVGGGDADFAGHGPDVSVSVSLALASGGDHVDVVKSMFARETRSDYTTASGTETTEYYRAPSGFRIEKILSGDTSSYSYRDTNHDNDEKNLGPGGAASKFEVVGDTSGDDAGHGTKFVATMNALKVRLVQTGDCASPNALRLAAKLNRLSGRQLTRLRGLVPGLPNR
jgi:hypothetical protein